MFGFSSFISTVVSCVAGFFCFLPTALVLLIGISLANSVPTNQLNHLQKEEPRYLPSVFSTSWRSWFKKLPKESMTSRADTEKDPTRSTILSLRVINPIRSFIQRASKAISNAFLSMREGFYTRASSISNRYFSGVPTEVVKYSSEGANSASGEPTKNKISQEPSKPVRLGDNRKYKPVTPHTLTKEEAQKKYETDKKMNYNTAYTIKTSKPEALKHPSKPDGPSDNSLAILYTLYNRLQDNVVTDQNT